MANERPPIFNKKAYEKLRSPDDLDKYVRVTNPSAWVALFGYLALLVGLTVWGIFGTVSTNINAKCVSIPSGEVICLISPKAVENVSVGDPVVTDDSRGSVESFGSVPLSRDEVYDLVQSDYLTETLMPEGQNWAIVAYVKDLNVEQGWVEESVITTRRVSPASALFGNGEES